MPVCNGGWDYEHYTHTMPSFTGGLNYEFSKNMSAYVRANSGNHLASLDDITYAHVNAPKDFAPVETIRNYEAGLKFQTSFAYLDLSAYHRTFDGIRYQGTTLEGVAIPGEYGAVWRPLQRRRHRRIHHRLQGAHGAGGGGLYQRSLRPRLCLPSLHDHPRHLGLRLDQWRTAAAPAEVPGPVDAELLRGDPLGRCDRVAHL